MDSAMPTVRRVAAADVIGLRHRVLRVGHPPDTAQLPGDGLPTTRHFAAVAGDGAVVGCASMMRADLDGQPAWQLRGMATDAAWAGRGLGRRVLDAAESAVVAEGPRLLWCNARRAAEGFYRRLGWAVCSGEFDIPGFGPHVRMRKPAPPDSPTPIMNPPALDAR